MVSNPVNGATSSKQNYEPIALRSHRIGVPEITGRRIERLCAAPVR